METTTPASERKLDTERPNLDRLLRPRSIVLIGASSTSGSLADCVVTNLEDSEYKGDLFLVNPKRPVIHGRQCFGSIDELPSGIDCAVLAIPAVAILDSVRACAAKQIGSVIVFSAGFAESGAAGLNAQAEMARIARDSKMILEGPNCLGMVNYLDGVPLTFVMTPPQPASGVAGAAILSQSGALAAVISVNMRHHCIPLSFSISTGNEAANGIEEFLEHLAGNQQTKVFALVVEQFRDPQRFLHLARRVREAGQNIVLLHPGRSKAARLSAVTHTGAIAGDYEVMRTLVTRAGVIVVDSMEELVDVTQMLVCCRELPAGGAAIFTESGAFKAVALDLCESVGLPLPPLSSNTENALRKALPPFIPPSNPLDLTAQVLVDPDLYRRTLPTVLTDENFGSVLLGIILTDSRTTKLKVPPLVDALSALRPSKPVVFAALDEGAPFDFSEIAQLRALGVPCFPSAERAMRALAKVAGRKEGAVNLAPPLPQTSHVACQTREAGTLSEVESKSILRQLGIVTPRGSIATTLDEATCIAAEIGFPVVLKAHSSTLAHKTEAGGVMLDIPDQSLATAWESLQGNIRQFRPDIVLDGILVERMAKKGTELIIGGKRDPKWGPVLLAGMGGVHAEVIGDVRLLPPDLSIEEIHYELSCLRGSPILQGFRGSPTLDIDAVARILSLLGAWMLFEPRISEIDINPLVVYPRGQGAVALDALISIAGDA